MTKSADLVTFTEEILDGKLHFCAGSVRLVSPAKNEVGRWSKSITEAMKKGFRQKTKLNQWKHIEDIIDWFKIIKEKHIHIFVIFDINDLLSIKNRIFNEMIIKSCMNCINISSEGKVIIKNLRIFFSLFNNQQTWMKKESGIFDMMMDVYGGAKFWELVGIFIL